MIAVDSNLLVYAHREDSAWHEPAAERLELFAEGRETWAIPWPCIHEFLAIVTHPRVFNPPTPLAKALDQVAAWMESPSLQMLAESGSYWDVLASTLKAAKVQGARVHDARVAALCLHHGIRELWTADRDLSRFAGLSVRNPLVG